MDTAFSTIAFNVLAADKSRIDLEKRERTFIASDETPVLRRSFWDDYMLIVSHAPGAVDLHRVGENGSCMFIENHNSYSSKARIGKFISGEVVNSALQLTARINTLQAGNDYLQEVQDKCEPGKSIRFDPYETELISEAEYQKGSCTKLAVYKLVKWGLLEVSTVTIPAIGGVGFSHEKPTREDQGLLLKRQLALFGKHLPKRKLADILR